jgi:threonine/homoserine/homoserine lactone efflux protein
VLETLFSFALATAILALSPGPDNIFVLTQSLVYGKRYGLATVYGLITGCIVHTTLLAFGVSLIIKESETLFFTIKFFGAIYLLFLAFKVYKSDPSILLSKKNVTQKTTIQLFKQGFVMNVFNPKVSIFFLAFFPGFLFSKTLSTIVQFYILGLIFMVVSLIIFSLISILAANIATSLKNNLKIGIYLKWLQILVFVVIAFFIFI